MFELSDIKEIRKSYQLDENGNILLNQMKNKNNENGVTLPSELSEEDMMKVKAALFLHYLIKSETLGLENMTDEDRLKKFQEDFTKDALKNNTHTFHLMGNAVAPVGKDCIWVKLLMKDSRAMNYFRYVLSENGKKPQNLEITGGTSGELTVSYTLTEKARNSFIESLNPNNSQYTKNSKRVVLSPEDKAKRRAYVEKAIQYYDMMEHDSWYQQRIENEEKNMQRIANIINNNGQITTVKNDPGLFRLLKAAKNLTIDGGTDYLEEVLSQRAVHEALVEFKKSEYSQKMKTQALQNEQDGKVNSNGLLEGHNLSQGEKENHSAQVCIRQNPNVVSEAKQVMAKQSHIEFSTTTDDIRLSNLYSLIARTQGKIPSKTRSQDTIIFDADTGKEK